MIRLPDDLKVATNWQILLVGKDQKKSIPELVFVQHPLKLFPSFGDTLTIADITVASLLGPLELVKELSESSEHTKVFSWVRGMRSLHGRRSWNR